MSILNDTVSDVNNFEMNSKQGILNFGSTLAYALVLYASSLTEEALQLLCCKTISKIGDCGLPLNSI